MLGLLQVVSGPDQGRSLALTRGVKHTIGREPNSRLQLRDPQVSRVHCVITVQGDRASLADAGSTLGTFVNGQRITEHELQSGEVIRIGSSEILFHWSDSDEQTTIPWKPGTEL